MNPLTRTGPELAAVEELMQVLCTGERLDWLGPVARSHLETGGKRMRARLALSAAEAFGLAPARAVPWAAAAELLHNASLIHDDVQDGDRMRRGQPALWARFGVPQAINAGDLMLILPNRALEHVDGDDGLRWRLARAAARAAEAMVRGQASELNLARMGRVDWASYRDAALGKTAALFGLPVEGAALLAGWSAELSAALAERVGLLGLAFQVQDDVLDLYGDKGRDRRGSDLFEGKVSALVVEHLALHPDETDEVLALLRAERDHTDADAVDALVARFATGGALAGVWRRLRAIEDRLAADPLLAEVPRLRRAVLGLLTLALEPIQGTDLDATPLHRSAL